MPANESSPSPKRYRFLRVSSSHVASGIDAAVLRSRHSQKSDLAADGCPSVRLPLMSAFEDLARAAERQRRVVLLGLTAGLWDFLAIPVFTVQRPLAIRRAVCRTLVAKGALRCYRRISLHPETGFAALRATFAREDRFLRARLKVLKR